MINNTHVDLLFLVYIYIYIYCKYSVCDREKITVLSIGCRAITVFISFVAKKRRASSRLSVYKYITLYTLKPEEVY